MKKERRLKLKRVVFDLLVAFAIIAFWRGVWELMDLYLFPADRGLSAIVSVGVGLLILVLITYSTKDNLLKSI